MNPWIKINKGDPATWPPVDKDNPETPVWCHLVVDGRSWVGYRNPPVYEAMFHPLPKYANSVFHCYREDSDGYEHEVGDTPTHWMPFPEPPAD